MKLSGILFLLSAAAVLAPGPSTAAPTPGGKHFLKQLLGGAPTVPAEWSGIWTVVDTVYDCAGAFQSTSTSTDTLCTGQNYEPEDQEVQFDCTGTVTETTVDMTCTGSYEVFTDCTANYVVNVRSTRTAESYFSVVTMNVTYSGTGENCDLLPAQCLQINSHGTRTAPEPAAYCASPVEETTWGQVKSRYR
jgi:hypothetical protein